MCRVRKLLSFAWLWMMHMIDMVHKHGRLILLFGFNVQLDSNLTYLYSYILILWWLVLRIGFMCPKPSFYILICVISIASMISLQTLCRRPSGNMVFYPRKLSIHIEACTRPDESWQIPFSSIENVIDTL